MNLLSAALGLLDFLVFPSARLRRDRGRDLHAVRKPFAKSSACEGSGSRMYILISGRLRALYGLSLYPIPFGGVNFLPFARCAFELWRLTPGLARRSVCKRNGHAFDSSCTPLTLDAATLRELVPRRVRGLHDRYIVGMALSY